MTTQHKDWTPTLEQRVQLHDGLTLLQEARVALQDVHSPQWQEWRQAQELSIDNCQQTFTLFLSGEVIPAGYVFAEEIDSPAFLLRDIRYILCEYPLH